MKNTNNSKDANKTKKTNNVAKTFKFVGRLLIAIVIVLSVMVVALAGTFFFMRWQRDAQEKESGDRNIIENIIVKEEKEKEPVVTCLFLGINGGLTDFIMFGQYDPNTREIDLLSIPRDTNVGNASVDGKINAVYTSHNIDAIITQVEKIVGKDVDYYVLFKTSILRKLVDKLGGVTVDVPINMNYDDPYQNLYIHLKKGTQKLTGSQAEQFVRFRKNNDGTGYSGGDVERTKAQQKFIKAFISELLTANGISKLPDLIDIVIEGTKTNVTLEDTKQYIDDIIAIRTDRITANTIPGVGKYAMSPLGYNTSYYFIDENAAKAMISEMFDNRELESGDTQQVAVVEPISKETSGEQIRVELLNAGASSQVIGDVVDKLKNAGYYVVKIGNYETTKKENSKIIDYGIADAVTLNDLEKTLGFTNCEARTDLTSDVAYTVMIGPYYNK